MQKFLGHKSVKSTEVYINIEQSIFESSRDTFTVKVAQTPEEIQQLLETEIRMGRAKRKLDIHEETQMSKNTKIDRQISPIVARVRYTHLALVTSPTANSLFSNFLKAISSCF